MTLIHQIIGIGSVLIVVLIETLVLRLVPVQGAAIGGPWLQPVIQISRFVLEMVVGFQLAWWICRVSKHPPLRIAWRCPHCRTIPPGHRMVAPKWPRGLLVCGACHRPFEVWLQRHVPPQQASRDVPSLCLRWPEFLGRWKAVPGCPPLQGQRASSSFWTESEHRPPDFSGRSVEELRGLLRAGKPPGCVLALEELLQRKEDVQDEMEAVVKQLGADRLEQRHAGWLAILRAYPETASRLSGYFPSAPLEDCRRQLDELRKHSKRGALSHTDEGRLSLDQPL